jgi:hypothetical protein
MVYINFSQRRIISSRKMLNVQRQPKVILGGSGEIETLGLGHNAGRTLFAKSTTGLIGGRGSLIGIFL